MELLVILLLWIVAFGLANTFRLAGAVRPRTSEWAGVCAAIARCYNMDVQAVRILWVVGTLVFGGFGLLLYLICWAMLPQE